MPVKLHKCLEPGCTSKAVDRRGLSAHVRAAHGKRLSDYEPNGHIPDVLQPEPLAKEEIVKQVTVAAERTTRSIKSILEERIRMCTNDMVVASAKRDAYVDALESITDGEVLEHA